MRVSIFVLFLIAFCHVLKTLQNFCLQITVKGLSNRIAAQRSMSSLCLIYLKTRSRPGVFMAQLWVGFQLNQRSVLPDASLKNSIWWGYAGKCLLSSVDIPSKSLYVAFTTSCHTDNSQIAVSIFCKSITHPDLLWLSQLFTNFYIFHFSTNFIT